VIEGAWLRLRPQPETVQVRVSEVRDSREGIERGIELGRRGSARVAALVSPGVARSLGLGDLLCAGSCGVMVCELAGDAAECEGDARWLEDISGAAPLAADAGARLVDALRTRLGARLGPQAMRARIALTPGRVGRVCEPLAAAGAELIVHPSAGLVFAELCWDDDVAQAPRSSGGAGAEDVGEASRCAGDATDAEPVRAASQALERVGEAAREAGGVLVIEEIPSWAKTGRDVLGDAGATLSLMRSVKARFDPKGTLNPGRFVGGL
jgi:FAD/FMN-containing dehydrogenase